MMTNGYRIPESDIDSVGDWDGREELACDQIDAICREIADLLPRAGDDGDDQYHYDDLCAIAWERHGSGPGLLTLSADDLSAAAREIVNGCRQTTRR